MSATPPVVVPLWPADTPGHHQAPQSEQEVANLGQAAEVHLHRHDDARCRGLVLICPGGGYSRLADHEAGPIAAWAQRIGLHGAVLRYRRTPWRHPTPQLDLARALRLLRHRAAEWAIDPQRIAVLGFSAGGHLAASLACDHDSGDDEAVDPIERCSSRPDAAVLCYPVLSFAADGHEGSRRNLLGMQRRPQLEARLSWDRRVTRMLPPVFLWHTAEDRTVPVSGSLRFAAACARQQVPIELHVFPQGRHGLGLADTGDRRQDGVAQWTDLCATWFGSLGWLPSEGRTAPSGR